MIANKDRLWAERMGKNAMRGRYLPAFFAAAGILIAVIALMLINTLLADVIGGPILGFALALSQLGVWFLLALLWYERRIFYEIIIEQRKRISELETGHGTG